MGTEQVKAPCKGCEERTVGCHSGCARYAEWTRQREAVKAARAKDLPLMGYISDKNKDYVARIERHRRKRSLK